MGKIVTSGSRKLHNEEFQRFVLNMKNHQGDQMKKNKMNGEKWHMFGGKNLKKKSLGRQRNRQKNNIKLS